MNIGVHMTYQISVFIFFKYIPRSGILDHKVVLSLVFWGTSVLFSIVAVPIYIPMNSVLGFRFFLHILTNTYYLLSLIIAILIGVR